MAIKNEIEVITLFVGDLIEASTFYRKVFEPKVVYEDENSCVLEFGAVMVNLLQATEAPELVEPTLAASPRAGVSMLLTIKISDVDAVCANLQNLNVELLNGPVDRPWRRRTVAFADPDGYVWEVAQELG
jgi:catechol 2,3-dioxygenase-like lactoylglutathione lyase family enzyme